MCAHVCVGWGGGVGGGQHLVKVYHKCAEAHRHGLSALHACVNSVHQSNLCLLCRHIWTNQSHEHDQTDLEMSNQKPVSRLPLYGLNISDHRWEVYLIKIWTYCWGNVFLTISPVSGRCFCQRSLGQWWLWLCPGNLSFERNWAQTLGSTALTEDVWQKKRKFILSMAYK